MHALGMQLPLAAIDDILAIVVVVAAAAATDDSDCKKVNAKKKPLAEKNTRTRNEPVGVRAVSKPARSANRRALVESVAPSPTSARRWLFVVTRRRRCPKRD